MQCQYYALQVFKLQDQRAQRNSADLQSPLIQSIRVALGAAALRALTVRTAALLVHGFMKHMT